MMLKIVGRNSYRKYFPPRVNITNYNVSIDGRNFMECLKLIHKCVQFQKSQKKQC